MSIDIIHTHAAPAPGGAYSQAIRANQIVATAGQVGVDPATGDVPEGVSAQTRLVLSNLKAVLEASGTDIRHVIKTTCFLADIASFSEFNEVYAEFFGEHLPARSTFGVALGGGFLVEIEALAVLPE